MPETGGTRARRRTVVLWSIIGAAVLAVAALVGSGRLNATVLPTVAEKPAVRSVQCFDADGNPASGWSASEHEAAERTPVDPVAVCDALYQDHSAAARMDQIATQQQVLGRECVIFPTANGETWYLTGLEDSPDKTYVATGGPAPGRLPAFGQIAAPAPLASLPPVPTATAGCVTLPTVAWDLSVPPMAACASDDVTVLVYVRPEAQNARAFCSAQGLVVAGR